MRGQKLKACFFPFYAFLKFPWVGLYQISPVCYLKNRFRIRHLFERNYQSAIYFSKQDYPLTLSRNFLSRVGNHGCFIVSCIISATIPIHHSWKWKLALMTTRIRANYGAPNSTTLGWRNFITGIFSKLLPLFS